MAARRDPSEFVETYAALKRCITAVAANAYAEAGLGTTQAKFLRYIGQHERISQAELARATDTHPSLTGRVVQNLIERGLVRRHRSDEDQREYLLELGAEGRRVRARVEKLRAELAARLVDALDDRDLSDFDRVTRKILAAFEPPAG